MATTQPIRCAIWARVSTSDQHSANQLDELRTWAAKRGLEVAREFIIEDSAWQTGNGKGKAFDAARAALLDGVRFGEYTVVLVWAIDRLSRRGIEDTLTTLRVLAETGATVWSRQESFTEDLRDPRMLQLFVSVAAWVAEMESARRSERVKAGIERRRRDIEAGRIEGRIGGRKAGSKDRKPRSREGYTARWQRERAAREGSS